MTQTNSAIVPVHHSSARLATEGFFRQRHLFWGIVGMVLLATIAATFLMPKRYLSEMKFLVQNGRENVVVTAERTNPPNVVSDVTEEQVNSELEILHSHDVIDPIADPGWASLTPDQQTPDAWRKHEKLLTAFDKRYGTEVVRKTNVINVSIRASSPEEAQSELEKLSAAYLAEHRRLQRPAGATEFFGQEAERSKQAWDDATKALVDFQQAHQLVSLPDQEITLNSEIREAQDDLFTADSSLHELDAQLAEASTRMKDMPSREITEEKASPNQQSVQQLNSMVVELENKRTDLAMNYKPTDRSIRDLDQQIATAKAALQKAETVPAHEQTTNVDPAWQQVHTNYVQNQITRRATAEQRAKLSSRLQSLQQDLATLQGVTVQFNNLQSHADEMKANYELYAEKRDQAQSEDAMDAHKLLNVAVAEEPTFSSVQDSPKVALNIILGTFTALFLGLSAVYFAELGRHTIATPRELDALSRYPVLATLPLLPASNSLVGQKDLALTDGIFRDSGYWPQRKSFGGDVSLGER